MTQKKKKNCSHSFTDVICAVVKRMCYGPVTQAASATDNQSSNQPIKSESQRRRERPEGDVGKLKLKIRTAG